MKNLKWMGMCLLLALIPFLQSCLDSNETWPADTNLAIVTVRLKDAAEPANYYLVLENGKTVNPIAGAAVTSYKAVEGQRAFAYLRFIEEGRSTRSNEYDHHAEVFYVENILTKDIIDLTPATADSIGDDRINLIQSWISNGYVTLEFQLYGSNEKDKKHMLNLVTNTENVLVDDENYINLEFRHNAFNDDPFTLNDGLVSFKLDKVAEELKTAKGLKIRVNTIHGGIKIYMLDLENHANTNAKSTMNKIGSLTY